MQLIRFPAPEQWDALTQRPYHDQSAVFQRTRAILDDVKKEGDKALLRYSHEIENQTLESLAVTEEAWQEGMAGLDQELKDAMQLAARNIRTFHQVQLKAEPELQIMHGVNCWRRIVPIERVGLYIPGGSAPLFSTVLMLAIPATIAGCREIVMCTPPDAEGKIHPALLYAAELTGVTEIYALGGAQAIGLMGYGSESIQKVDKIFGPGNQYVTAAKQLMQFEGMAIDMPAGPSEVCVWANGDAEPEFIAADLLSQAEHGPDSQVVLVSTAEDILQQSLIELEKQLERLPRKEIAAKALQQSRAILLRTDDEVLQFVNAYACEHLIVAHSRARELANKVTNAGSIFIGNYSPEAAGDYASGTNHTLPTNGAARAYSGVSVDSFVKKITCQELTPQGIISLGPTVRTMAEAEGLDAHARAVTIRLDKINKERHAKF